MEQPKIAISNDCHVYLVGRQGPEIFNKYKDYLKTILRAKYDPDRSAWRITPSQVPQAADWFRKAGFSVVLPNELTNEIPKPQVRVRYAEGKMRFKCNQNNETFNEIFNNKSSMLSGITEYLPDTYERATTSFYLSEEAIGVLDARGFQVIKDKTYVDTYEFWKAREEGFKTMDPIIASLLPAGFSLFQHQNKAVVRIEKAQGKFLLGAAMGCIDGEAFVTVNRAGCSRRMKLKDLHAKFHGKATGRLGNLRKWDLSIPTTVRCFFEGKLRSMPIHETFFRGKKPTVKLSLDDGKELVATPDHRILTTEGWRQAAECLGLTVLTNGTPECYRCGSTHKVTTYIYAKYPGLCFSCINSLRAEFRGTIRKDGYRYINLFRHPNNRGNVGIGQHRLVVEADMNGMTYDEWIKTCAESRNLSDYKFLPRDVHVHHKNGNKLDNILENLEVMPALEHYKLHGDVSYLPVFKPKTSKCIAVVDNGEIDVYDIHVPLAETFVANGIVVHNSGKTLIALAYAAKHNLRVCVVCPKVVRRNWVKEAGKFFPTQFLVGLELDKRKGATDLLGASIVSVNYEGLAKWAEDIIAGQFDLLVIDESHYCKSETSIRTQLVTELSKHFQFKILLSGTAIKNNRDELNPQLTILDPELYKPGCALFKTPTGYFWHAIQSIYMAMPKNEVLPFLPKKTVARHDQSVKDPVDLPSSIEEIMLFKHKCAMSKIDITCEKIKDILENSDDAILVFSEFVDICQEIHRRFKKESLYHDGQMSNDKREHVKEFFQRDDCAHRVFVSTRPSLAVGATLTRASHVVFNDLPWCPADIQQAEDRTHRLTQTKPVHVYWIIAENSAFDVRLIDLIGQKYAIQKAVTEGKQVSKEEQEFLATPISFRQLLKGAKV